MIKNFRLKFGKAPGVAAETIPATPVTVFVGPNNSGKSKVLSEIRNFCTSGEKHAQDVILDHLELETFNQQDAEEKIKQITLKPHAGEAIPPGYILVGKRNHRQQVHKQSLIEAFANVNSRTNHFCPWYLTYNTLMLDGESRIRLINQQQGGDLQYPPQTSFQVLFRDPAKRTEVRRIIHEAFEAFFVIDPTNLGHFRLRLSSRAPQSDIEERGIHEAAIQFHAEAVPIERSSDGVKAFTGMITEIMAGDPLILLIDEPEAFLHPSLAYKLGYEIARASIGSEKRLFVSTHSPNFVMGCVQSGTPVNIIRLTYRGGIATARVLPNQEILRLMRNPLLRSTRILQGLFYEFVVVTESDTDRAFYEEINERLLHAALESGIPNCLFINAQNKQTVHTIMRPLRDLGILAAGIVDVDVLKEGGTVWSSFLQGGYVPPIDRDALSIIRAAVLKCFAKTGKDMKREGGIKLLAGEEKEAARNLFERLAEYGLFVVPHGEIESWLPELKATGHGPDWLTDIFEKMGEDPASPGYLRPTDNDVWAFVGEMKKWFTSANRKGIPD